MKTLAKVIGGSIVATLIVMLAVYPDIYMSACKEGLDIFIESVFPALFPFFFFTGLLGIFGADKLIKKLTAKPVSLLYGAPSVAGYIMALSFLSGYPVGAKLVAESYKNGIISADEAKRVIPFCSTSGPLFIVGVLGYKILGSAEVGALLLAVHLSGAIINGFVFASGGRGRVTADVPTARIQNGFNASMDSAIVGVLKVGGCIIVFNMAVAFMAQTGVLDAVGGATAIFGVSESLRAPTIVSLLEVTKGACMLDKSVNITEAVPILSFALAFGGASVAIQSMSFLSEAKIKTSYYLVCKTSQAIISYALAVLLVICVYGA